MSNEPTRTKKRGMAVSLGTAVMMLAVSLLAVPPASAALGATCYLGEIDSTGGNIVIEPTSSLTCVANSSGLTFRVDYFADDIGPYKQTWDFSFSVYFVDGSPGSPAYDGRAWSETDRGGSDDENGNLEDSVSASSIGLAEVAIVTICGTVEHRDWDSGALRGLSSNCIAFDMILLDP